MPSSQRRDQVLNDRQYITALGPLLMALGLHDVRLRVDTDMTKVLAKATERARLMRDSLVQETYRAQRLQASVASGPVIAHEAGHHVQYRALDADEGVVERGEWVPLHEDAQAKAFMVREIELSGRGDLTLQKLVRCSTFEVTTVAMLDEQR